MKALKLQCCDAGKPSKAISSNRAAMGMLIMLIVSAAPTATAQPGVLSAITDGIVADYAFHGHLYLPGGSPAVGYTVWVVNGARTDSLGVVTDSSGRYENDPLTSVPDAYRQGASLRAFPNPDPRTLILESPDKSGGAKMKLYDVRGREVTDDQRIPAGAYIARATTPSGENATVKVVFSQSAEPDKLTLEQRITNTPPAQTQKSIPLEALEATVKVNKQGYEPIIQQATLQTQHTTIPPIELQENGGIEQTINGDAWDITGSYPLAHATVKIFNATGDSTLTTTNDNGEFQATYTITTPDETLRILVEKPEHNIKQTGALLAQGRTVVVDGRIIAAASFTQPDTLTYQANDERIQEPIRIQLLKETDHDRAIIRQGTGFIFNREAPYVTEIINHEVDVETGETGMPVPPFLMGWFYTVANNYNNELTQPNGTVLNTMTIVETEAPSFIFDNRHYVFMDDNHGGPGNIRGEPNENGHFKYAMAFVPLSTSLWTVMEEYIGAWVTDDYQGDTGPYFTSEQTLSEEGKIVHGLHHLLNNGTNCYLPPP